MHMHSDEEEPIADPAEVLRQRLHEKYAKQRGQQLASKKKVLDSEWAAQSERFNELHPISVELVSDETTVLMNELEALCASNGLSRGVELVHIIRASVNKELRESLSYVEKGYTSAFNGLLQEVEFRQRQQKSVPAQVEKKSFAEPKEPLHLAFGDSSFSVDIKESVAPLLVNSELLKAAEEEEHALRQLPEEWKKHVKREVLYESIYQKQQAAAATGIGAVPNGTEGSNTKERLVTIRESLSETTNLFAESLATLLLCEVVRIYLYDENRNLHCCASFPYCAQQGDPMRATFTEIMIAKEVHSAVCNKKIAVNGGEAEYHMLNQRDLENINQELEASGLQSMRSCLIFPIVSSSGSGQTHGMIHAVNKRNFYKSVPAVFSSDDEVIMSASARVLGCILSRYPVHYFSLRVGEAFRKVTHPHADTRTLFDHLPAFIVDEVEDAAEAGNHALGAATSLMIYRAPINDVYQTRFQRARNKKLGALVIKDSTLASVEFNLSSITDLWRQGMEENVMMHRQYRDLATQEAAMRLLLRNLLDGLAATRSLRSAEEMTRYLHTLELLGRTESTERLADFVSDTFMGKQQVAVAIPAASIPTSSRASSAGGSESVAPSTRVGGSATALPGIFSSGDSFSFKTGTSHSPKLTSPGLISSVSFSRSAAVSVADPSVPFLSSEEMQDLARQNRRLNARVASKMHIDGPEFVRAYSSDPITKRAQVRFIEEVARQRQQREDMAKNEQFHLAHYELPTCSVRAKRTEGFRNSSRSEPPGVAGAGGTMSNSQYSKSDFALKRPFVLK